MDHRPWGHVAPATAADASHAQDEESLAERLPRAERKLAGIFFTPQPLVRAVLTRARELVEGPVTVVDPATGGGAFLAEARRLLPSAPLLGLEQRVELAAETRERLPGATILEGDALLGGLDGLVARAQGSLLFVGNPPYNGASPLLANQARRAELQRMLGPLPRGNSLRDDYAFFLMLVARALQGRSGALAFVTPASLLDAFLYAPLRRYLLERLELVEVWDLGHSVFRGAQVRSCATFWKTPSSSRSAARFRSRAPGGGFSEEKLGAAVPFVPEEPEFLLRPLPADALELDHRWRREGEPLTTLVPVSFPGLKTRFDELLTDDDPQRLLVRVQSFLDSSDLEAFAAEHGLDHALLPKLSALRSTVPEGLRADPAKLRPFFRYNGPRHRGRMPPSARGYCYLERALIPRGDHRLRGDYDPHRGDHKLIFNLRELPLSAAVLDEEGCIHAHRHARFAPLLVPRRIREEGLGAARDADLSDLVPNLSPAGLQLAARHGGPRAVFEAICRFLNSEPMQRAWAPAFATTREPPIPLGELFARERTRQMLLDGGGRPS